MNATERRRYQAIRKHVQRCERFLAIAIDRANAYGDSIGANVDWTEQEQGLVDDAQAALDAAKAELIAYQDAAA